LAQWSREIPADAVYEALTTYGELDEPSRDKINHLVMAKRSFKAIKGEMTINSGVPTEETARQMKELQAVLKLDSIDIFGAKAEERVLLEQRLSAWVGITSQDKRVHVEQLKPILKQEKGVDALDVLNATATYLLSISKSLGKTK
jgi:beta-phosphoglucomutase-like phosphatase (HAD superfamily)